jgi:hypothetical protein
VGSAPPALPVGAGTLSAVLPSVLASLGSPRYAARPLIPLTPARRAVVVLVDGLGDTLVRRRAGHAPFLRSGLAAAYRLTCGFPSTTATSMGSFGTGLPPGAHGLVGYEVLVPGATPETDRILNELSWDDGPDPFTWQPEPTVFEAAEAEGVAVTRVGPGFFDGSGLTNAALRGGRFRAAYQLATRVDEALAAVRATPRALVYLYWGERRQARPRARLRARRSGARRSRRVDAELRQAGGLRCRLRYGSSHVTADHGMVEVPFARPAPRSSRSSRGCLTGCGTSGPNPVRPSSTCERQAPPRTSGLRHGGSASGRTPRSDQPVRGHRGWAGSAQRGCPIGCCRASATSSSRCGAASPSRTPAAPALNCSRSSACTGRSATTRCRFPSCTCHRPSSPRVSPRG